MYLLAQKRDSSIVILSAMAGVITAVTSQEDKLKLGTIVGVSTLFVLAAKAITEMRAAARLSRAG